jgi:hypothetical protein
LSQHTLSTPIATTLTNYPEFGRTQQASPSPLARYPGRIEGAGLIALYGAYLAVAIIIST